MLLPALFLLQATPIAMPADKPVACPAAPAALPTGLAGWTALTPITAGATARAATTLTIGRGARTTLQPSEAVVLPVVTAKPALSSSNSGVFAFTVAAAGRYRVALGAGVWVDVVAHGIALPSVAHEHGPACSPIRKMVDYDLTPQRYLLQVVGSATPTLQLMVTRIR